MSVQSAQNDVARALREVADLEKRLADEAKKEADIGGKQARIRSSVTGSTSSSTLASKARDLDRLASNAARVQSSKADISKRIATKRGELNRYQERLMREERSAQKQLQEQETRRRREAEQHNRSMGRQLAALRANVPLVPSIARAGEAQEHDFFISHASEDKEDFVRSLAEALTDRGARVWYDEFTLRVGDSLRRAIDRGLAGSRFGIVVLSEHFFRKEWPARELDGLVALEVSGKSRMLPIWHKVSKDEVVRYSPTLADKVALNTTLKSVDEIADELVQLIP